MVSKTFLLFFLTVAFAVCLTIDVQAFGTDYSSSAPSYEINGPSVVNSDSTATFCLSLNSVSNTDGHLEVKLIGQPSNKLIDEVNVQSFKGNEKCFSLYVPSTDDTKATMFVDGHFGYRLFTIKSNTTLYIKRTDLLVSIVTTPKIILPDTQQMNLTICTKQTKDKSVPLGLKIKVTRTSGDAIEGPFNVLTRDLLEMTSECYSLNLTRKQLELDDKKLEHLNVLNIDANVTEKAGKEVSVTEFLQVDIKSTETPHFKPSTVYNCQVSDKKADGGPIDGPGNVPLFCSSDSISTLTNRTESMDQLESKLKSLEKLISGEIKSKLAASERKIDSLEKSKAELEQKLNLLENRSKNLSTIQTGGLYNDLNVFNSFVYRWTISDIKKKLKFKTFDLESATFPLNGYCFGAKVKLQIKDDDKIHMSLAFIEKRGRSYSVETDIYPKVTYILRDMSGNVNNKDVVRIYGNTFQMALEYEEYGYKWEMVPKSNLTGSSVYVIGDSIVIDIAVEPPSIANRTFSNNGVLTWQIDGYKQRKNMELDGLIEYQQSPYFYTSPHGYRVQTHMRLNGYGGQKGKGFTAAIVFLTGEFDSSLPDKFKHTTTITLYNRKDPKLHLVRRGTSDFQVYFMELGPQNEIESNGYVVNDTLLYTVSIEAA